MSLKDQCYRRNLPHIHPEGYPLFITFRLADSLSLAVLAELQEQRERELKTLQNHSPIKNYKIEQGHFGRYDEWLDRCAYDPRWLKESHIASIVAEKMRQMDGNRYRLLTYCIMPNHVHLLIEPHDINNLEHRGKTAKYPVADTLRLLKGSTARYCNLALQHSGAFWHHESYDHYVRDEQEQARIIQYILSNPGKAGLVNDWEKWSFTYLNPELGDW
jgi:REP element-mobilizing transposase RayT